MLTEREQVVERRKTAFASGKDVMDVQRGRAHGRPAADKCARHAVERRPELDYANLLAGLVRAHAVQTAVQTSPGNRRLAGVSDPARPIHSCSAARNPHGCGGHFSRQRTT